MTGPVFSLTSEEVATLRRDLPPSTADDVGITTFDGRHLRTKDEIMAWLAEVEPSLETARENWKPDSFQV